MTADAFRRLALSFPETVESSHMDHPDFRVRGKIFATLSADGVSGVVMLTPDDQEELLRLHPEVFLRAAGAWGLRGSTRVMLRKVRAPTLRIALESAWRNKAPGTLLARIGGATKE
jgi:hypothetical protein